MKFNSPIVSAPTQFNPIVLHGDNLFILLQQNGTSNGNLIALQNCSKHCFKYEWKESEFPNCSMQIEPRSGCLKSNATKLFHISIKSFGCALKLQSIPLKCRIYRHKHELAKEIFLPNGYFEYTDNGYYEKVRHHILTS
jgi:hypothetical protein